MTRPFIDPDELEHSLAVMWAAGFGRTETVKALLDAGAKPDLKDNRGMTAQDIARAHKQLETVLLLEVAQRR